MKKACSPVDRWVADDVAHRVMSQANVIFGQHAWKADATLRESVRSHAMRYANDLAALTRRRDRSQHNIRRGVYHVLRSFDARLCALILAWPTNAPPISFEKALDIAAEINPRKPSGEAVSTWLEAKPEGGDRRIWSFGVKTRAMQRLAVQILMALWGPAKFEFARRGRGRDAAMSAVVANAELKGGARWFLTADISNCFASFNREELLEILPLPRAVIENCLFVMEDVEISHSDNDTLNTSEIAVWSGLPQGSLASPYIASKLIEQALEQLTGEVVVSHVDDILVGCRTKKEAQANELLLGELFQAHPAGPLLMKSSIARLGQPIDYLGYRVRRRWCRYGGGIRLTPSPKSFTRFEKRAFGRLKNEPLSTRYDTADKYITDWTKSHRLWDRSPAGDDLVWLTIYAHVLPGISANNNAEGKF